jgi:hypothetical protein
MGDVADYRAMELLCQQRAEADPGHSGKWLGQADGWRDLAKRENAWRLQRRNKHQQMCAGPMQVGPNIVNGQFRSKQQG